jgi:enolase
VESAETVALGAANDSYGNLSVEDARASRVRRLGRSRRVLVSRVRSIRARDILDSRGLPTVEVDIELEDGARGRAAVPSGVSKSKREAFELRDADAAVYRGMGVGRAIAAIHDIIAPVMRGCEATDQLRVDAALCDLDGTDDKRKLGANSLLGVSMAVARAAAASADLPLYRYLGDGRPTLLPVPLFNLINGGAHADDNINIQELLIAPLTAASFREALRIGAEVYQALKAILRQAGLSVAVGAVGGFAPRLANEAHAFELIMRAIEMAGFTPGRDIGLGIDMAASEFYQDGVYVFRGAERRTLATEQMIDLLADWVRQFPIVSIEDGLAEDDWDCWELLTIRLGRRIQLVGDDLLATNAKLIRRAAGERIANAVLVKLNQTGTVSETRAAVTAARAAGYGIAFGHRSGETNDDFIADFAVALSAGQIKTGAPCRGERVAKYNQLLRIEEELGTLAHYAGASAFAQRSRA